MPVQVTDNDPDRPWYEPGVFQVAAGLFRMPMPMPSDGLRAVNTYLLLGSDTAVLIDPGTHLSTSRESLRSCLAAIGLGLDDVDEALVTHVHFDHYGQAALLRRDIGMKVRLGEHEAASLEVMRGPADARGFASEALARFGAADLVGRRADAPVDDDTLSFLGTEPDHWIVDDEQLSVPGGVLTALHTPGHTRGHVVLRDPHRRMLFAGDHILPSITPSIGFEPAPAALPLAAFLGSLRRVRALPDTRLLPAHGQVTESVHTRIDSLLDHHSERLGAVRRAVAAGASTGLEVAQALRWTTRRRTFEELDRFNRTLAVLESGYHLDLLVERGTLMSVACDGVHHFELGAV